MTLSKGFIYNVPHSVRPHTARKTYWLQLSEINLRVSLETNTNVLKTTLAGFICYYYSIQANCDRKRWTGNESESWQKRFRGEQNGRAHRGRHKVHSFTSSLILLLTWVNVLLYNFRTSDPSDQWPVPYFSLSTLPRSNWLRRASIRLAWYRHMPASSLFKSCWKV